MNTPNPAFVAVSGRYEKKQWIVQIRDRPHGKNTEMAGLYIGRMGRRNLTEKQGKGEEQKVRRSFFADIRSGLHQCHSTRSRAYPGRLSAKMPEGLRHNTGILAEADENIDGYD